MKLLGSLILATACLGGCALVPSQIVKSDPLTVDEHVTLGHLYAQQGKRTLASEQWTLALARDPEFVPAHLALGNLRFEEGRLDEAADHYQEVLRREPDHSAAANNLAMVWLQRGERLDEARRLAYQALRGDAQLRPYVLETLVSLYLLEGDRAAALPLLDQAEALAAGDDHLRRRLDQARRDMARLDRDRPSR